MIPTPPVKTWFFKIRNFLLRDVRIRNFNAIRFYVLGGLLILLVGELVFLRLTLSRFLVDPSPRLVCNPSLAIDRLTIQVDTLNLARDGSLQYPNNYLYRAYWVMGTFTSPAFLVSPAPDNPALVASLVVPKTATLTWANCKTARYRLSVPKVAYLNRAILPDQTVPQIVIFFPLRSPTGPSGPADSKGLEGWIIRGEPQ